ncbi:MAG TPA: type II toxin-antitoxin system HicB family antitoxin [Planctomycetota bacterium]|nr:type II toxin-antitoxin system HicB family antitoxin [Planctomycetota bacterium]
MHAFNVIVERDLETGLFVGSVPGWSGAHSQGSSVEKLEKNLQQVIGLLLEDGEPELESEFVGLRTIRIASMGSSLPDLGPGHGC